MILFLDICYHIKMQVPKRVVSCKCVLSYLNCIHLAETQVCSTGRSCSRIQVKDSGNKAFFILHSLIIVPKFINSISDRLLFVQECINRIASLESMGELDYFFPNQLFLSSVVVRPLTLTCFSRYRSTLRRHGR